MMMYALLTASATYAFPSGEYTTPKGFVAHFQAYADPRLGKVLYLDPDPAGDDPGFSASVDEFPAMFSRGRAFDEEIASRIVRNAGGSGSSWSPRNGPGRRTTVGGSRAYAFSLSHPRASARPFTATSVVTVRGGRMVVFTVHRTPTSGESSAQARAALAGAVTTTLKGWSWKGRAKR